MPTYTITTRVELHKDDARKQPHSPTAPEYDTLHTEMHKRGYRRYFEGNSGKLRKLSPGEYRIEQSGDTEEKALDAARDKAKAAATIATSKDRFSLLLTCGTVYSYALEIITKDPDA